MPAGSGAPRPPTPRASPFEERILEQRDQGRRLGFCRIVIADAAPLVVRPCVRGQQFGVRFRLGGNWFPVYAATPGTSDLPHQSRGSA